MFLIPKVVAILGKELNDKASISRHTIVCQQPRNTCYIAKKKNVKKFGKFSGITTYLMKK